MITPEGVRLAKQCEDPLSFRLDQYQKSSSVMHFGYKFENEVIKIFSHEDLIVLKSRLAQFLMEMALHMQTRLPDNLTLFKKVFIFKPCKVIGTSATDTRSLSNVAAFHSSLGDNSIDISSIESEWRYLMQTTVDANNSTPLLQFWSQVGFFKGIDGNRLFPCLTRLIEALFCLPVSNATVERLFSVMNVIKTKLRNRLAVSMVEALLLVRTGMKRKGQNCTFVPLPSMFKRFNKDMYSVSKTTANSAEPSEE